jgi:heme oxygenase
MELHPTDLEVLLAKYPGDEVANFCTHIRKAVHERPWTLVSYAWCFYMAVFSGGRWIRAGLMRAGSDFWHENQTDEKNFASDLATRGLSFWHFPGQFDGEDIKVEFKEHLAAAETLFTPDQRVDIIEEAKNIFQLCANLIEELDDMVGKDSTQTNFKHEEPGWRKAESEKKSSFKRQVETMTRATEMSKSSSRIMSFVRRPEVTGTLVALGCLACVTLLRFQ